jgi:hypothetical protein
MNGALLQQRIYAGYAKAAKHTGRPYAHYRAPSPLFPVEPGNLLGDINCLFAAEKRFQVPNKYKIPTRYLYADGRELQQRDILVGPYGTFFVGDMQPNLPMQAVWCNDSIAVERPRYVDTALVPEQIAFAVPCFRQLKRIDQKPVSNTFGATNQTTPIGEWFLYVPISAGDLRQNDDVIDATGRRYKISTIDPTEIGTVLVIRQSDDQT